MTTLQIGSQLLSLPVGQYSYVQTKEFIIRAIKSKLSECVHIVSLNPEHVMLAQKEPLLAEIIRRRSYLINDGVGIIWAAWLLGIPCGNRIAGVDLMQELLRYVGESGLCVLLIGAQKGIAESIVECYQRRYPNAKYYHSYGYDNIKKPLPHEEKRLIEQIKKLKPDIIFVAFGAPWQEYWIDSHRKSLQGVVCMGVGGGFDFISGFAVRAPQIIQRAGLEWLFRLMYQPWRILRQIALIQFIFAVFREKIRSSDR